MKQGKSILELAKELQRRSEEKQDLIAETGSIYLNTDGVTLEVGDAAAFAMTPHAGRQMGTWAGIPAKYADKCKASDPALFAMNMNHWLKNIPARRMVRTLDGDAHAFLSDRYRRIDNEDVAEAVLPVLMEDPDIKIASSEITDNRMYLKALFPKVEAEISVGDVVQAGVLISNSEIGAGSLQVQPLVYRLYCSNGMVSNESGMTRYHVGRKVEGDGKNVFDIFRDETLKADDTALMMKLADVVRAASSQAHFGVLVDKMREATGGPKIVKPAAAVEVLGKSLGFTSSEGDSVLENLIRAADYSRYGALNAVTAVANDLDSYDRASEFEVLGGKVLNLPTADWQTVAEAA